MASANEEVCTTQGNSKTARDIYPLYIYFAQKSMKVCFFQAVISEE